MIKTLNRFVSLLLFLFVAHDYKAQDTINNHPTNVYIEPAIMIGKIVPTKMPYPLSNGVSSCFIDVGFINKSANKYWVSYYNFPSTGVSFSSTNLGNEHIFGNAISIAPFIQFKWARHTFKTSYFKFGIGSSYFTKHYNSRNNYDNVMIGSPFTWNFQIVGYRYIYTSNSMNLRAGIAYLHNSNGHIQLPNNGLNSAMFSLAAQVFTNKSYGNNLYSPDSFSIDHTRHSFLQIREGNGVQEFGGRNGPTGSTKKGVYTAALSYGIIFNQQIKVRAGIAYRYYQHYYEYITQAPDTAFLKHSKWNASNVFAFIGFEFLVGRFSIDVEEGINIYKPFYPTFFNLYERGNKVDFFLKKWIPSRMGLDYYVINIKKKPRNNFFIGAYINANFGQADFSELTVGFCHALK